MVSRVGGRAPRIAWSSFHDVAPAPPNLPRVRSFRSLQQEGAWHSLPPSPLSV